MSWLVRLRVPTAQLEAVSTELWSRGTTGIAELGTEGGSVQLVAGFKTSAESEQLAASLEQFGAVSEAVPPWPTPEPTTIERHGLSIEIDAGPAFGHGAHPTTELALDFLLADPLRGPVLDVGCGTGILAIAAAMAGATPVVAIDIDLAAVKQTKANADRNNVSLDVSATALDDVPGLFDHIVANMLPIELQPLAGALADRLQPKGSLIVSGFLSGHQERIADFFPTLRVDDYREHGDWGVLRLR